MSLHRIAAIDELATWVTAYREACTNRDNWAEIADRAKRQIAQAMDDADAEIGTVDGRPAVRYTQVVTNRLDTKRLKAEHPDLAAQFITTSYSSRFTLIDQVA